MSITVQEFFPDVKNNLTKIMWKHAVNSKNELKSALESNQTHMIEADVSMGTLIGGTNVTIPVMAHPPKNASDLSLEDFIKQVNDPKIKKGVKLDFKSIAALQQGVGIILKSGVLEKIPVWLNADILKGPLNSAESLSADDFLAEAVKLNQTLLSLGWNTNLESPQSPNTTANYTAAQITEMSTKVKNYKIKNQPITYPVRARYAANDVDGFQRLLKETADHKPTLTIWSAVGDLVNATNLSNVINKIGVDKVYIDVPEDLYKQLKLSSAGFVAHNSLLVLLMVAFVGIFGSKIL